MLWNERAATKVEIDIFNHYISSVTIKKPKHYLFSVDNGGWTHTVNFISPKTKQNVKKKFILVGVITSFIFESKNALLKFEDTFFTIGVLCMILNFS